MVGQIASVELERPVTEPDAGAADIDPMSADRKKRHLLAAMEEGRVDHDVVQMLAADVGMVHDQHVARLKTVFSVHAHAIDDGRAEIGQKNRQRAKILGKNSTLGVHDADAIVAHLVDHHVVGSLAQHRGHLIGDMGQPLAHHFNGDRVHGRLSHYFFSSTVTAREAECTGTVASRSE